MRIRLLALVAACGCGEIAPPSSAVSPRDVARAGNRDAGDSVRPALDAASRDAASRDAASRDAVTVDAAFDATLDGGPADDARSDAGSPPCDYRLGEDDVLRIEAEDLPLVESWSVRSEVSGFSGRGYAVWTGRSYNNDPGHGFMALRLRIPRAGRYRLQWRNRIGKGTEPTEHNDTWVRFSDADDYYGKRGPADDESRRYPEPICKDAEFIGRIRAVDGVSAARCAAGSTKRGWMKVYSSGARDWKWSTRTSDHDAHDIHVEYGAAGVYTLELSARADFHLIDRIVLHEESVAQSTVEAEGPTTPCVR